MKKIGKLFLSISLIFMMIISLSGCRNSNNDENSLKQKVNSEISYIDGELVEIANQLNGIDYARYKVDITTIQDNSKTANGTQNNKNNEENSSNGEGSENASGSEGEESGQKKDEASKSTNENQDQSSETKVFSMQSNVILGEERETDWDELKGKIENLYTTWTTIAIDLKELDISSEELNLFSQKLDDVAVTIKNEEKNATLNNIIDLYEFLPKFTDKYGADKEKILLESKYNLLQCYKYAELEDWEQLSNSVSNLKISFSNITNKKDEFKGKDINIKSAGVIINEMNNSVNIKDKDVFFIKYKILMQEFNTITGA